MRSDCICDSDFSIINTFTNLTISSSLYAKQSSLVRLECWTIQLLDLSQQDCSTSEDNDFGCDISEMQISVLMFSNKQHPVSNVLFTLQKGER